MVGLWSVGSQTQELDSAAQAYRAIATCMGLSKADFGISTSSPPAVLDTAMEMKDALNAGGRQVVIDWPYDAEDTVTIAVGTFRYTLNSNFMQDSLAWRRYVIFGINRKGDRIYNVPLRPVAEFDVVPGGPGSVAGAQIKNRTLFIFPAAPAGDKLYIYGPGDWIPVTGTGALLTAIPEDRLWGAVYWAAALLLDNRGDARAQEYRTKYAQHVTARRGQ